jgi:UDP-N-acetylmuramoyl-L-alanyl-D-glutamate--2,6-diaminopimelate ligase
MRPITPASKSLHEIKSFLGLADLNNHEINGVDVTVTGITSDSRSVQAGDLFIALAGATPHSHHGAEFLQSAQAAGAVAVLTDGKVEIKQSAIPVLVLTGAEKFIGDLASWFFNHPSRSMFTVGITGTNGKTTTASLLHQLWTLADREAGSLGTLGIDIGSEHFAATHTTPDAARLQNILACMSERHVTHAVMEVSSHALVQHRAAGTRFSMVGFTQLSQDHLDFHGDMESYFQAKSRLFTLEYADLAVINIDSSYGVRLMENSPIPVVTLSRTDSRANWSYVRAEHTKSGYDISIRGVGGILIEGFLPLIGQHNLDNALMAIAMAVESGVDSLLISARLRELDGIPGRLEVINLGQEFTAIVDFAHSPDSVERVLKAVRESTSGKLIGVLGCGGDRDKSKRALMGQALVAGTDYAIFTSDNPRSEDPLDILRDMTAGITLSPTAQVEVERRRAIAHAVALASAGDCVILLGKGHESGQEVNGVKLPFDDRIELAQAIGGSK